jgi:HEAT repeat protein
MTSCLPHQQRFLAQTIILILIGLTSAGSLPALASTGGSMKVTLQSLQLPFNDRLAALHEQGEVATQNLVSVIHDRKGTLETRWRAVTALGRVGGPDARAELERAFSDSDWFIRNAALVTMRQYDSARALYWAKKLLQDKALVVRSAAVDTLAQFNDRSSTEALWQSLAASENFRGQQSLFIRRRIVETLAQLESSGHEGKFIAVLNDRDESLHEPALHALERLTKTSMNRETASLKVQRAQWLRWWEEKKTQL